MSSAPAAEPHPMFRLLRLRPAFTPSIPLSNNSRAIHLPFSLGPAAVPLSLRHSRFAYHGATPRRPRSKGSRMTASTTGTTAGTDSDSVPPPPPPPPQPPSSNSDRSGEPGIVRADLRDEMSRSYLEYAMSVILGRAMPDLRDGLKPVHRRILFAMHDMGLSPGSPFRKSARVVGEVLGKYHPHGDTAVYDALVRMAQTFSMSAPLVAGHGNFGSTDGDPAAAMRYTEARLSPIARDALLSELDRDTVEFIPTFDGSEREPRVLPARYPNLLVNGSAGIAVGMATNIPPHNLREVTRAVSALIREPDIDDVRLAEILPGPDFPTGGQIIGRAGIDEMNRTGRGRIVMRACVHTETLNKTSRGSSASQASSAGARNSGAEKGSGVGGARRVGREALVFTELPYQVNKAVLVAKIAELVNEKKVDGVADLRDESDRNGTRVVIELKRDAQPALVLSQLFQKTQLQTSFAANMVALDNGQQPIRLTLRDYLTKFISFRRETVLRRLQYELRVARDRLHIVKGLLTVQDSIDEVIATIRAAPDAAEARKTLIANFGLSERQASSVLDMQLRRLTQLESDRLRKEAGDLETRQRDLELTIETPSRVDDIIVTDLQEAADKFGSPRRSKLVPDDAVNAASVDDLIAIPNDKCVMVVTDQGYIKRMAISSFDSQNRGTRGKRGFGRLRTGDRIVHLFTCMTRDSLVALSSTGVAYKLAAYKVPMSSLGSRGVPIFQLLPFVPAGETIASVIPVSSFSESEFLVLLSRRGYIKKLALTEAEGMNVRGRKVIILEDGDELMTVKRCTEQDSLVIATRRGLVMRFRTDGNQLRSSGRASRGVRSIRLGENDVIADMDVLDAHVGGLGCTSIEEEDEIEENDDHADSDDFDDDDEVEGNGGVEVLEHDETFLLAVTKNGTGKRVAADMFGCQRRGGRGTRGIRLRTDNSGDEDEVVAVQTCQANDSVMLVASDGTIVRTKVRMIPVQSKRGRGVRIQRLIEDDTVAAVAVLRGVAGDDDDDDDEDDDSLHDMELALGLETLDEEKQANDRS